MHIVSKNSLPMSRHMSTVVQTDLRLGSDSMFPDAIIISCLLPTGLSVLTQGLPPAFLSGHPEASVYPEGTKPRSSE